MVVSLVAAEDQGTKADEKSSVTTGSADVAKNGSKQTLEVPPLLRSIPGEQEADKLKRMAQFIKENRPQLSKRYATKPAMGVCFLHAIHGRPSPNAKY